MADGFRQISQCTIYPQFVSQESRQIHNLTPWELSLLSTAYNQGGFFYDKPQTPMHKIIDRLKDSLCRTLPHFPTLTGSLVTQKTFNPPGSTIVLDCTHPQGAEFIHAQLPTVTMSEMMSPNKDVPKFMQLLFPLTGAVNHDGHTNPFLSVQLTEFVDGFFLAFSINHCIVDAYSYSLFVNSWAEICRGESISHPPVTKRWFLDPNNQVIHLPYSNPHEYVTRYAPPRLRVRLFHFSAKSILQLKARANADANTNRISAFQALNAFLWKAMTRARNLASDQETCCKLSINDRIRLNPALPETYFGTCIQVVIATTTAGELLGNNLGWSASMLYEAVASHTTEKIRNWWGEWAKNPPIYHFEEFSELPSMLLQNSPRHDIYGNDFGFGKPLGIRCGRGNTFDGNIFSYQAKDDKGSMDLEISLSPESMAALLLDDEFMAVVTPQFPAGISRL